MIIHTVMGNRTHPEYGVASIPVPIPTEEYPRIIEMLEALEIGDVLKSDCHIAETAPRVEASKRASAESRGQQCRAAYKGARSYDSRESGFP